MDTRNNHLVTNEMLESMPEELRRNYQPVPRELNADALRALDGQQEVRIGKHIKSRLAQWAAKDRNKAKRERKAAKSSRKRNRK